MSKFLKAVGVLGGIAAVSVTIAFAQDPCKISPEKYKVLVENDRVRVLEVTVKPGETSAMHSHPDYSIYVVSGGTVRFFTSDSDTGVVRELPTGQSSWRDAEVHSAKNVGTTTLRAILTELKEPKPAPAKK